MEIRSISGFKIILPLSLILSCSVNKGGLKVKECETLYLEGKLNESAVCCISSGEDAIFLFAMILADKGYYSRAKILIEDKLSSKNPTAHFVMGYIHYREGDAESAERELLIAEKEGMKSPDLYLLLSLINAEKCDKDKAIFYEEKLKESLKNPDLQLPEVEKILERCSQ
jgi:hypothetical protein